MANSVDITGLLSYTEQRQKELLTNHIIGAEFAQKISLDFKIHSNKTYPKIVVKSNSKAYDGIHDAEANKIVLSETAIKVNVLQDDYSFDPEQYRHTFLGEGVDISGNVVPLMQLKLEKIIADNIAVMNQSIIWNAATNRPGTDPSRLRQTNGFAEMIRLSLLSPTSGIRQIATGALTTGSGLGNSSSVVEGNIQNKIFLMDNESPLQLAMKPRIAYMSYENYYKIVDDQCRRYLGKKEADLFTTGPNGDGIYAEKSQGMLKYEPCHFMGLSNRVAITTKENMIYGTDIGLDTFGLFSTDSNVYKVDLGFKMVYGFHIPDFPAMTVNDLA